MTLYNIAFHIYSGLAPLVRTDFFLFEISGSAWAVDDNSFFLVGLRHLSAVGSRSWFHAAVGIVVVSPPKYASSGVA